MIHSILNIIGYVFLFGILALIGYIIFERTYNHPLQLSAKKAISMIKSGEINKVVDVRTDVEWERGHFPGAVHLPLSKINEARLILDVGDGILLYCNTGTRARQAAIQLKSLGFNRVFYIAETYHEL